MQSMQRIPDEKQDLRRCMRDLVALSTLPAIWGHTDPLSIVRGLADVLLRLLSVEFVYVRLHGRVDGLVGEVARTRDRTESVDRAREIGQSLARWLPPDHIEPPPSIPSPVGEGMIRLAVFPLGHAHDYGLLAAGCERPDFPTDNERLLLGVAVNQATGLLQQKVAEKHLRRSEEELSDFFENASVGMHWVGPDGIILRVNQAELDLLGYAREEYVGRHIADFHVDQEVIGDFLRRLSEREILRDHEAQMKCKDGSIMDVLIDSSVLWESGQFIHTRCFTRDITARKQAEAALREREKRYELVLTGSGAAIWDWDIPAKRVEYSPLWKRIRGYTDQDVSDREEEWTNGIHPEDRARVFAAVQAHFEGKTSVFAEEYRVRHKSGHWIWIMDRGLARHDHEGRVIRMAGSEIEITDRKLAEEALGRQNERLRLLSEAAGVLLTTDEPDAMLRRLFGKIGASFGLDVYFNFMVTESGDALRLASCVGISEEAARSLSRLEFGQAVCGMVALQRKPIAVGGIQESSDPRVQLVKGYGIRAYACNPLLAGSRLLGTLSFASRFRDHFDQEEIEFLGTITRYVAAAYERLRLIEELRKQDRRKDEFLATLAHELRNPLAPIRNAVQILKVKPAGLDLGWTRDVIDRQVGHMARLLDDLLDISRITRSKLELRKTRVRLSEVVSRAVETSQPLIDRGAHDLTINLPDEPIYLDADPVRLGQVFANLLNNAAKYTPNRGHIRVNAKQEGGDDGLPGEVVVSISDTGIGITPDMLPQVFEMFSQAQPALERSQGGLGVGLALTKGLVEMHGGTVVAHSEGEGRGSEFVVRLPVAPRPADVEAPRSVPLVPRAGPRCRILVADDNDDSAMSLDMLLRTMGYDVRTAHDGKEALRLTMEFKPSLALLDIGMPNLNGYEVAGIIRQQSWANGLKLVALTGWGQQEDKRRAIDAGFNAHMTKPIDFEELQSLLRTLLAEGTHARK